MEETWFTYTVTDQEGTFLSQTFTITVTDGSAPLVLELRIQGDVADQVYEVGQRVRLELPPATGGTGAITYALTGELPRGLSFEAATGPDKVSVIRGVPAEAQEATKYKYTATDEARTDDLKEFTITVNAPPRPPAPTVTLQGEGDDSVINIAEDADGITFSGTATAGETVRVSANGNAIAVAIAAADGAWRATARPGSLGKSGDANVTATVTNAGGTATAQLTLSVDLQAPTLFGWVEATTSPARPVKRALQSSYGSPARPAYSLLSALAALHR